MSRIGWNISASTSSLKPSVMPLSILERNAIDGACLEVLNEDDLNELGIASNVKRKKLLQWITQGLSEYKQFVRKNVG